MKSTLQPTFQGVASVLPCLNDNCFARCFLHWALLLWHISLVSSATFTLFESDSSHRPSSFWHIACRRLPNTISLCHGFQIYSADNFCGFWRLLSINTDTFSFLSAWMRWHRSFGYRPTFCFISPKSLSSLPFSSILDFPSANPSANRGFVLNITFRE